MNVGVPTYGTQGVTEGFEERENYALKQTFLERKNCVHLSSRVLEWPEASKLFWFI